MQLGKAIFVLPSLFTLTSVFLGFSAISWAAAGHYTLAGVAILFAIIFDSVDGRVARMTRTQTQFGVELDSLADVISFGAAPAVLVYQAYLKGLWVAGPLDLGLVLAFTYLTGGVVRLARYNVDAHRKPGVVKQFTGLPIPGGAGLLAGLVTAMELSGREPGGVAMAVLMVVLGVLMVSTVKYPKTLPKPRSMEFVLRVGLLAGLLGVVAMVNHYYMVALFFAYYIIAGLVESTFSLLIRAVKRRASRKTGGI